MTTYISLLRGINVNGKNRITMDALRKSYGNLGFGSVRTYVQSGNVVFTANDAQAEELAQKITQQIKKDFGVDVPVIVLTIDQLQHIVDSNPFLEHGDTNENSLYITFLSSYPHNIDIPTIEAKKLRNEEVFFAGNAVYLYCHDGYGNTKLTTGFFETKLNLHATTRNWKTTNTLLQMALQ
ncbi:MAG: DUF1697 domain-containing protein [Bacteroidales bacterium]|nr:DUF1697 domain-containing protein [Bacteroidales bacterium]HOY39199.1 DUF1697 domain-containing protein [Bacteroidales bacterium]HQP03331.1 DUF1697 domain-containing protein [Bacteroidales bacterium]